MTYDIIGSIAILKFKKEIKAREKKKTAEKLLKEHKNIETVLEKSEKIKGRLRVYKIKWLAGEKTRETIHNESSCKFKLDVEKCYFSPRLSGERLEVAGKIKKNDNVLVMFSGAGPYSIVIGKISKPKEVVSVELGRECCKYALENVKLNKLDNVQVIQGDVKRVVPKLARQGRKFDKIVMPRPQLKDSFLKEAFSVAKKNTEIYYYDFGKDVSGILERIYEESRKAKKNIKVLKVKKAGEVAPYKFRWRVDLKIV